MEGIEPPLLAEHDFESCASTSSATRAQRMTLEKLVPDAVRHGGRLFRQIVRQEAPLYIPALAASIARQCTSPRRGEVITQKRASIIIDHMRINLASARRTGKLPQSTAMELREWQAI